MSKKPKNVANVFNSAKKELEGLNDKEREITVRNHDRKNVIDTFNRRNRPMEETHLYRGFYLEEEVVGVIDRLSYKKAKGAKSDLVNQILKDYFIDAGEL